MVQLRRSEIRLVEETMAFPNGLGYVLDFSDRTISEYFEDEFKIDIEEPKYEAIGTSKRKRLLTILSLENAFTCTKILRALWDRREGLIQRKVGVFSVADEADTRRAFLELIAKIEGNSELPRTDALERYTTDRTLDELIMDIERDLAANKPEVVMDHLHTYCMKKFAHLLRTRGVDCRDNEPLHARFGKYRKELMKEQSLNPFTDRALKSAMSMFESFNDIRNHHSLAHDNPILETVEARYVFDTISAILVFLRAVEAGRYNEQA